MIIHQDIHLLQLRLYTPDEERAQLYALAQRESDLAASWRHIEIPLKDLECMDEHLTDCMNWEERKPPGL